MLSNYCRAFDEVNVLRFAGKGQRPIKSSRFAANVWNISANARRFDTWYMPPEIIAQLNSEGNSAIYAAKTLTAQRCIPPFFLLWTVNKSIRKKRKKKKGERGRGILLFSHGKSANKNACQQS